MKRFVLFMFAAVLSAAAFAIPARKGVISLSQPDGSSIEVSLMGDEFFHYYVNAEGQMLEQNAEGFYVVKQEQLNQSQIRRTRAKVKARRAPKYVGTPYKPARGMAILVNFKDVKFSHTNADFKALLNEKGYSKNGATGSAADYFSSVSFGQYNPTFDVFGPYDLDNKMAYYGGNDASGSDLHPDQMVVDAMAKLAADPNANVNFADYDADGDGYFDNVFIYYAGNNEAEGGPANTVWPHAWEVYPSNVTGKITFNGITLSSYACTSECPGKGKQMCGIGTFCHEFGHVLGLPDFYDTEYSDGHKTLGDWDIMDGGGYLNNGNTPPSYSAHERFFLGWLKPTVINSAAELSLEHIESSNKAYMITETGKHNLDPTSPNPKVYYLLENRQNKGWDSYLPGHGLMITKTTYNQSDWDANQPNNNKNKMGYDLIEADGKAPKNNDGKPGDLFPGSARVTSFKPFAKYPISMIKEANGVISFTFMNPAEQGGGGNEGGGSDGSEFIETFDKLTVASGTDISEIIDSYTDNAGWTGFKLFANSGELKAGSGTAAGFAITPALPFNGDITITFDAYGKDVSELIVSVDGTQNSVSTAITGTPGTYTITIKNFTEGSKLCFEPAAGNVFYLDNVKIGLKPVDPNVGASIDVAAASADVLKGAVEVSLAAKPAKGFNFVKWSDDNTQNPRIVAQSINNTVYASFAAQAAPVRPAFAPAGGFSESFAGLTADGGTDISSSIDTYADNAGWTGYKLFCSNGVLKVGSNKNAGHATTPAIPLKGDITITFDAKGKGASDFVVNVEGAASKTASVSITTSMDNYSVVIKNVAKNSKFTFKASSTNVFYLDNVVISAADGPTPSEEIAVSVASSNKTQGSVEVSLNALPKHGYKFIRWSDDNTQNPRIVTESMTSVLLAYFEADGTLPTDLEAVATDAVIYSENNSIFVRGNNAPFYIFDVTGRLVDSGFAASDAVAASKQLPSGIYVVAVKGQVKKIAL